MDFFNLVRNSISISLRLIPTDMPAWVTSILQIIGGLVGISKNISDGRNAPEVKEAAKAQQEIDTEAKEAAEVAAVLKAKTPTEQERALGQLSADAAE